MGAQHPYQPVLVRTRTIHRPVGPFACDCVELIVVCDGAAILFSEFGEQAATSMRSYRFPRPGQARCDV